MQDVLANFDFTAEQSIALAREDAASRSHPYVSSLHLLIGVVKSNDKIARLFEERGVTIPKLDRELHRTYNDNFARKKMDKDEISLLPRVRKVCVSAQEEACKDEGSDKAIVSEVHVLRALLRESGGVSNQILMRLGLQPSVLYSELATNGVR